MFKQAFNFDGRCAATVSRNAYPARQAIDSARRTLQRRDVTLPAGILVYTGRQGTVRADLLATRGILLVADMARLGR